MPTRAELSVAEDKPLQRDAARLHRAKASHGQAIGPPALLTSATILALQRSIGNAAVAQMLASQEADRDRPAGGIPSPVHAVVGRGGGAALPETIRQEMEPRLGADLGSVRVHTDARSANSVGAAAYTVGDDIVVHPSRFSPGTAQGRHLLAHETVHVVQQRRGPVAGTPAPGGIRVSDPSDRFEREAEAVASGVTKSPSLQRVLATGEEEPAIGPGGVAPGVVQRVICDRGASIDALSSAVAAKANLPRPTPGFFSRTTAKLGQAVGHQTKASRDKAAWTKGKQDATVAMGALDMLKDQVDHLEPKLSTKLNANPKATHDDLDFHLATLDEGFRGFKDFGIGDVDAVLASINADRNALALVKLSLAQGRLRPAMSWENAIEHVHREGLAAFQTEMAAELGKSEATFLRGDKEAPALEALLKSLLGPAAQRAGGAFRTEIARLPKGGQEQAKGPATDPFPARQVAAVEGAVRAVSPLMFDPAIIDIRALQALSAAAEQVRRSKPKASTDDWAKLTKRILISHVFLKSFVPVFSPIAAEWQADTTGRRAAAAGAGVLQSIVNGVDPGAKKANFQVFRSVANAQAGAADHFFTTVMDRMRAESVTSLTTLRRL